WTRFEHLEFGELVDGTVIQTHRPQVSCIRDRELYRECLPGWNRTGRLMGNRRPGDLLQSNRRRISSSRLSPFYDDAAHRPISGRERNRQPPIFRLEIQLV